MGTEHKGEFFKEFSGLVAERQSKLTARMSSKAVMWLNQVRLYNQEREKPEISSDPAFENLEETLKLAFGKDGPQEVIWHLNTREPKNNHC
ncbi:MAG: hypothetical protein AAB599_02940 [Patescibacteria group bacterium]